MPRFCKALVLYLYPGKEGLTSPALPFCFWQWNSSFHTAQIQFWSWASWKPKSSLCCIHVHNMKKDRRVKQEISHFNFAPPFWQDHRIQQSSVYTIKARYHPLLRGSRNPDLPHVPLINPLWCSFQPLLPLWHFPGMFLSCCFCPYSCDHHCIVQSIPVILPEGPKQCSIIFFGHSYPTFQLRLTVF